MTWLARPQKRLLRVHNETRLHASRRLLDRHSRLLALCLSPYPGAPPDSRRFSRFPGCLVCRLSLRIPIETYFLQPPAARFLPLMLSTRAGAFFIMRAKHRAKVDDNQKRIVKQLRAIPGVTVQPGHDDILVGFRGATYWFEVKREDMRRKDGEWKAGAIKHGQIELEKSWSGHYAIVCTLDEILAAIGVR